MSSSMGDKFSSSSSLIMEVGGGLPRIGNVGSMDWSLDWSLDSSNEMSEKALSLALAADSADGVVMALSSLSSSLSSAAFFGGDVVAVSGVEVFCGDEADDFFVCW